jgi:hypothetical protein
MNSTWFNVEHYQNTHSTQYKCTHYTLLSTARCFQSVCNSVTPWCVILFSTNSSSLVHPTVNFPPELHRSHHHSAGTFSWIASVRFATWGRGSVCGMNGSACEAQAWTSSLTVPSGPSETLHMWGYRCPLGDSLDNKTCSLTACSRVFLEKTLI